MDTAADYRRPSSSWICAVACTCLLQSPEEFTAPGKQEELAVLLKHCMRRGSCVFGCHRAVWAIPLSKGALHLISCGKTSSQRTFLILCTIHLHYHKPKTLRGDAALAYGITAVITTKKHLWEGVPENNTLNISLLWSTGAILALLPCRTGKPTWAFS